MLKIWTYIETGLDHALHLHGTDEELLIVLAAIKDLPVVEKDSISKATQQFIFSQVNSPKHQ